MFIETYIYLKQNVAKITQKRTIDSIISLKKKKNLSDPMRLLKLNVSIYLRFKFFVAV